MWSLYPDAAGLFPAVAIALNDQLRAITDVPVLADQLLRHRAGRRRRQRALRA